MREDGPRGRGRRACLDGPHGALRLAANEDPGFGFIADGVGITPIMRGLRGYPVTAIRRVMETAETTPPNRNRMVDLVRAVAIVVVVVWHWALSVTHRDGAGALVMPNPIAQVPFGWVPTWLLQVMPLFFVVGGYANLASWDGARRDGLRTARFLLRRARRLLLPTAVFLLVWLATDVALRVLVPSYRGVLATALVVFVPLWFLAAYLWVLVLVPVTARLHRRLGVLVLTVLGAIVVLGDLVRFRLGIAEAGWVNTALVWVYAHQLGYFWRDGDCSPPRRAAALTVGGLTGLAVATSLAVYPRSMVAVPGELSHMYPTTAVVAVLGTFQTGIVLLLAPALSRWLRRPGPWRVVIALNGVILTVFLWHMTALLVVIVAVEALAGPLPPQPTGAWWLQRPFWLLAPALVLAGLLAVFARVELARPRSDAR